MRRVEALPFGVRSCSVLQNRAKDPDGFIATDATHPLTNLRVFVSAEAVRIMGHQYGMVTREEVAGLKEDLSDANHRISQLELELKEADRLADGIDGFMKQGYVPKRAAGRPPKAKAN